MSAVGISTYCWRNCFVWVSTNTLTHYLYGKTYTYKNNNNKFFSIYNYLFRFYTLFGFQWTFVASFDAGGDDGIRTHDPLLAGQVLSQLSYTPIIGFVCLFSIFEISLREILVGPSGLEPPTSCLSGTRSNLLSYDPMWLVWRFVHTRFFSDSGKDLHPSLPLCQHWAIFPYSFP